MVFDAEGLASHGNLPENLVHDSRGQDDFTVWDRRRRRPPDRLIEPLNELLHPEILVQTLTQEVREIDARVSEMLAGAAQGRREIREIALVLVTPIADETAAGEIDEERIGGTAD